MIGTAATRAHVVRRAGTLACACALATSVASALPALAAPPPSSSTVFAAPIPLGVSRDPVPVRLAWLVAELDLTSRVADLHELCVDDAPGMGAAPLADLLASALSDAGFPAIARCPETPAHDDASGDPAARDAGFEWRLVVRPDDDGLSLELRAADRGLWSAPDVPAVVAWAKEPRVPLDAGTPTDPTPRPEPGVRLTRAFGLDRPVRALAACDLTGDGIPELAAVTDDRVLVWRERRGTLVLFGEWSFGEQARATIKVRDPIGGCVCAPMGPGGALRLAIGHSDLERGVVLAPRAEGTGIRLERERALPAIPLAWLPGGLASAEPDQGRNRFGPTLTVGDRTVELARPILQLAAPPQGTGGRVVALDAEHALGALTDGLSLSGPITASGAGIAVVPTPSGASYLAVTSRLRSAHDAVRLVDPSTGATAFGPIAVAGAIVASAAAAARAPELWIAARTGEGERTSIYRLTLVEPRP